MSIVVTPIISATRLEWEQFITPVMKDRVLYETDTGNYKVGDGISTYIELPYSTNISTYTNYVFMVPLSELTNLVAINAKDISVTGNNGQVLIVDNDTVGVSTLLTAPPPIAQFNGQLSVNSYYSATNSIKAYIGVEATSTVYSDVGVVLSPKGLGGITADLPDGTSVGGAARGLGSVDLQTYRSVSAQVASGNGAVITGGDHNICSATASVISGGSNNVIS